MKFFSLIKKLIYSLLLITAVILALAISSQFGLRLMLTSLKAPLYAYGIMIEPKQANGTLLHFTLHKLSIRRPYLKADIDQLSVQWQPLDLLNAKLDIQSLEIKQLTASINPLLLSKKTNRFKLPISINIEKFNLQQFNINVAQGNIHGHFDFNHASSTAVWNIDMQGSKLDVSLLNSHLKGLLNFTVQATRNQQKITANLLAYQLSMQSHAQAKTGHYQINTMRITGPLGSWNLSQATNLYLSQQQIDLNSLCLHQHKTQVCIKAHWAKKQLYAALRIQNLAADFPDLGIEIYPIDAALNYADNQISLKATAQSGQGILHISGNIKSLQAQPYIELSIAGSQFLLANLPAAKLSVSPKLQYQWQPNQQSLEGDIEVSQANIQIESIRNKIQNESDIVYLDNNDRVINKNSSRPISLNVNLKLSPKVSLSGLGISTQLTGELKIKSLSASSITATGRLQLINGKYQRYGKTFIIKKGELVYAQSPLDDPNLNIRAIYELAPSNSENIINPSVQVGVNVLGSLQHPKIELFSNPSLSQEDILSYIVLGQPFSNIQESDKGALSQAAIALAAGGGSSTAIENLQKKLGLNQIALGSLNAQNLTSSEDNTAIFVGKAISPRLYLRYGIGLFNSQQELDSILQLSKHWSLKTSAGTQASGADLIFTIDW
ncbi:MAG: pathogenicity protein [Gammaproteobacteria bacterium]|nr:pathogenicity protein [Gammaproteobacteria bacterium]